MICKFPYARFVTEFLKAQEYGRRDNIIYLLPVPPASEIAHLSPAREGGCFGQNCNLAFVAT
jgi:hypothetical protein